MELTNLMGMGKEMIKKGLKSLSPDQVHLFRRMYGTREQIKSKADINLVVDQMEEDKVQWALSQVERTALKNTKGEKQLRYIKTIEDDRSPVDGREHHRVQKLYRTYNGSYIVVSGLRFMHLLNEVKIFHSNSKGFVDGKFEIEAIYGTHNIEEALKAMGYTVRGEE